MVDRTRGKYRKALIAIRDGAGDPRTIAAEALAQRPKGEPPKDLMGEFFGRLEVIYPGGSHPQYKPKPGNTRKVPHGRWWLCMCQCMTLVVASTKDLLSGSKASCGCLKRESAAHATAVNNLRRKEKKLARLEREARSKQRLKQAVNANCAAHLRELTHDV